MQKKSSKYAALVTQELKITMRFLLVSAFSFSLVISSAHADGETITFSSTETLEKSATIGGKELDAIEAKVVQAAREAAKAESWKIFQISAVGVQMTNETFRQTKLYCRTICFQINPVANASLKHSLLANDEAQITGKIRHVGKVDSLLRDRRDVYSVE